MKTIAHAPFAVAGLANRVRNADPAGIGAAWQAFFAANPRELLPNRVNDDLYALYAEYDADFTGPYTLLIGYRLPWGAVAPEELTRIEVPAARQAVIEAVGEQPAATLAAWQSVWAGDLSRSYTVDFDVHDAASKGQRVTLNVALMHAPVEARTPRRSLSKR